MVRLFTTFYREQKPARMAEYIECINNNLACGALNEVLVLVESSEMILPSSGKLQTRLVSQRPRYEDFFAWINEVAENDDVSIISNSDIWFDTSVAVAARAIGERECFAMARWDGNKLFDRNDSQDCWIFRGRVQGVRGDFPVGIPRCDNRFLYELEEGGYAVRNPALSIRAHHVHAGPRVEYSRAVLTDYVPEPYRYLWPHNLWPLAKTLLHNALHRDEKIAWRVDRRQIGRMLPFRVLAKVRRMASAES